jgi:hypothetical protein
MSPSLTHVATRALRAPGPLAAIVAFATGCTTLGPMPATTGVSPVPAGRPGAEVQAGFVPGYYLSSAVRKDAEGGSASQASLLFEPDKLVGVPGLLVGGRVVGGGDSGVYPEAMLGYRRALDEGGVVSASAVAYGTRAEGSANGASYEATRGGVEIGADMRLTPSSRWVELHGVVSGSLTGLAAEGRYCVDDDGRYAVECSTSAAGGATTNTFARAEASGAYGAFNAAIALDFARHLGGVFHGGRLALHGAAGSMPTVASGVQGDARLYSSAGLTLSLGLGGAR